MWKNCNGILWLGIDFGVAAATTGILYLASKTLAKLLGQIASSANLIVDAVITVASTDLIISAGILLLISVLFITLFIIIRKRLNKISVAEKAVSVQ